MIECCPQCKTASEFLRERWATLEPKFEELLRAFHPDNRVGSANCDVNPLILGDLNAAAYRALEDAYNAARKYYALQIADLSRP